MARGRGPKAGGVAVRRDRGSGGAGGTAAWRPSDLQRGYRAVLDGAKVEPQLIHDTDGSLLVIEPLDQAEFGRRYVGHLADVAQFQAARHANEGKEPSTWANQTPYPWVAALDREEVDQFGRELLAFGIDAAQRGTLEYLEGNIAAWRSTAGIYGDSEQLDALLSPDEDDIAELFPPLEAAGKGGGESV